MRATPLAWVYGQTSQRRHQSRDWGLSAVVLKWRSPSPQFLRD